MRISIISCNYFQELKKWNKQTHFQNIYIYHSLLLFIMVDKRIVDGIKSEETQGYSEKQLKQPLLKQGYNQTDVNDTISSSKGNSNMGFNQFLSQKGTLFKVLFYILLVIFVITSSSQVKFLILLITYPKMPL